MANNPVTLQVVQHIKETADHYDKELKSFTFHRAIPNAPTYTTNWSSVLIRFIATVTQVVAGATGTPEEKKQAVIDATVAFWRNNLKPVLAKNFGTPWVFDTFIVPAIESEIPQLVNGVYDGLLSVFNRLSSVTSVSVDVVPY